jgi:hypothetical protein
MAFLSVVHCLTSSHGKLRLNTEGENVFVWSDDVQPSHLASSGHINSATTRAATSQPAGRLRQVTAAGQIEQLYSTGHVYVARFRQSCPRACSLEASIRVANAIPLACSLPLIGVTVTSVHTLKVH